MDFVRIAEMAKRLLDANGRDITVRRMGRTPADSNKPWRGSETPRTTTVIYEETMKAVFVEPYSLIRYGFTGKDEEDFRRMDIVVIASGKDFTDLGIDPFLMDEVIDTTPNVSYNVGLVRQLAPGEVSLLFVIGAVR